MKVIVYGNNIFDDYDQYIEIIEQAEAFFGQRITHIYSTGNRKGTDKLSEQYCLDRDVKLTVHKAMWNDIKAAGAKIKEKINPFTKKKEKYNSMAAAQRDDRMAGCADGLIICDPNAPGADMLVKTCKRYDLKTFIYLEESLIENNDSIPF